MNLKLQRLIRLLLFIIPIFYLNESISQVVLIHDSVETGKVVGAILKSKTGLDSAIYLKKKQCLIASNELNLYCIRSVKNYSDSLANYILYNDSGKVLSEILAPNVSDYIISNTGKVILYGSFYSESIFLPTYIYMFNEKGKMKTNKNGPFGSLMIVKFFDEDKRLFLFADSLTSSLMKQKKYFKIYDNNLTEIGSSLLEDDHRKEFLNFDFINEEKKEINFKYLNVENEHVVERKIVFDFTGKTLN